MEKYTYFGPVYLFKNNLGLWKAETSAQSPEKALNNLTYRFKKEHNYLPKAKIVLDKKYLVKESGDE